jgi:MFS family permease
VKTRFSTVPIAGLISAEFLSLLGNQIAAIAIPVLVLQQTHSTIITGIAVVGNNLPFVIAALIGGKVIDRFGAWHISIFADLLSFVSVVTLPLVLIIYANNVSYFLLLTLIFLGALFDPTGVAARHTLVPALSRFAGIRLDTINTVRGGLENGADFIGPVIGIGLISLANINNTFFVNALSFLFCGLIFVCTVPKKTNREKQKMCNDIFSGLRFIFCNTQLRILAVTGIITGFVISSFLGLLLLVLVKQDFHSVSLFGISLSVFSISATISALLFSKLNRLFSYSFIYYTGLLIIGIGICICGIATAQYGIVFSVALAGAAGSGNPLEQTILQKQIPEKIAGQVFATLPAIRFAGGAIGLLVTGLLTAIYNVHLILLLYGGLLILTAVCGWFLAPLKKNEVSNDL